MNSKANETWRSQENEDEELQYGPGIVNKLKTRYLSRTLREKNAGEPRRPSLRRAASLENWLDKDGLPQKERVEIRSPDSRQPRPSSFNAAEIKTRRTSVETVTAPVVASPVVTSPVVSSPVVSSPVVSSPVLKEESKKPDHLLLSKEATIIVEKSKNEVKSPTVEARTVPSRTRRSLPTNTRYNVEDTELPPPDTVRQVKRIFESNCPRPSRRSQSAGPGYRVPLPVENDNKKRANNAIPNGRTVVVPALTSRKMTKQSSIALEDKPVIITKPLLSPKPALTPKPNIPMNRRPVRTSDVGPRKISISSNTPTTPPIISPVVSPPNLSRVEEAKTKTITKEDETIDQPDNGSKTVSKTALENIRKESVSVNFRFDKKDEKVALPQSKQVGVIRPQVKSEKEPVKVVTKLATKESNNIQQPQAITTPTVAKETVTVPAAELQKVEVKEIQKEVQVVKKPQGINNKEQSVKIEGKVPSVDAVNSLVKSADGQKESSTKARNAKSWHNESTTTVFNFLNSPKKVDHIRNENSPTTIHLYKPNDSGITKLPDFDTGESSDFIDDMDILKRPPSPCNVHFEGANVIHQKSVLQRRSRGVKLNISFNDDMTCLFEYPSEASLLEDEATVKSPGGEEYVSKEPSLEKVTIGLSSYTPSKVLIENTFKLGISSSVDALPQSYANEADSMTNNVDETEYLRPSEQGTTWSSETTSDLLF